MYNINLTAGELPGEMVTAWVQSIIFWLQLLFVSSFMLLLLLLFVF